MYLELIVVFFIVILTYTCTKYILKNSNISSCKSEYYTSNTDNNQEFHEPSPSMKSKCILCKGGDSISNIQNLQKILNRLDDYY